MTTKTVSPSAFLLAQLQAWADKSRAVPVKK